jgi:hypothetical protein
MRTIYWLDNFQLQNPQRLNKQKIAEILLQGLQECVCKIYGSITDDSNVLLAELTLLADSLTYDVFQQRIDFCVMGSILRNDCPPLIYHLQTANFGIKGRCSMLPKVCGVDLYLEGSYTGVVGDIARQNFALNVDQVQKILVKN